MADILDIIKERRSIRNFEEKDVPEELLNKVLESIKWAPSWANTQCWEIIVIKDNAIKEELQKTMLMKNPATKSITGAPIVLAICGKVNSSGYYKDKVTTKFGDWMLFDLGIATQDICLTAHALGLGTVVVGLFEHDKTREIVKLPEGYELVSLIPMGYPTKTPKAPKRREIQDFTHYDTF